jgi:ribonuclease E
MGRSLLFDLLDPEEHRAAVVEDGRLAELALETEDRRRRQGDVYLGRVHRVEAAIEAAFVDIGGEKPGFLHADDVMPLYAGKPEDLTAFEARPRGAAGRIGEMLREGQKVLVQVVRDAVGTKGPSLTTYISLPGRWLVLMPSLERIGVSRRITDPEARDRARGALESLSPPPGMGFIVRTAGAGRDTEDLRREMEALHRVFRGLGERCRVESPPLLLLREGSLLVRTLRDWLASEVDEVVVNTPEALEEAGTFVREASPAWADRLRLHEGPVPLFHARGIEAAVDRAFERRVPLPGGGSLLIEPTEALIAVDVNSGKSTKGEDLEETALATDLKAAEEIARQLRLRDLGGLIVVDFIDVREEANREALNRAVRDALRDDRARVRCTPLSEFGLVEITRKRTGPSLRQVLHEGCPSCRGRGVVRTPSSAGLRALREARALRAAGRKDVALRASPEVAAWLRERKGAALEALGGVRIEEDRALAAGGFEVA